MVNDPITVVHLCDTCGKLSVAKKKPKKHGRFIRDDTGEGAPETFRSYQPPVPGWFDSDGMDPGGWWVDCGPFTSYDLVKKD